MKLTLVSIVSVALILVSCSKQTSEEPGKIPGMGNTPGQLEVKEPFVLPEGIHFIGDITGIENPVSKSLKDSELSFNSKCDCSYFGSGRYVRVKLRLLNSWNYPRTIYFRKGLVWQCNSGTYQHLMLCQTTWFNLQPGTYRDVYLDLYCVNYGVPAPDQNATYRILGVTSSPVIWNLLNRIGWKKINYEMIYGAISNRKGNAEAPSYEQITERMQEMVWNLTNHGIDLSSDDIAFIESIPELSADEIPALDPDSEFPDFFNEFSILEK